MVVKPIHVLAGKKKNNEYDQPKDQMESFHWVGIIRFPPAFV